MTGSWSLPAGWSRGINMPLKLSLRAPCVCGAQAKLEHVRRKNLTVNGIGFDVRGLPQYRCSKCRRVWHNLKVIESLERGGVAVIIQQKLFSPERLRFARKAMGLSQAEFAKAIGLMGGKALFSKYESGGQTPRLAIVQAIGLYVEKWFRDRWQLVPVEPFSFDRFGYEDTGGTRLAMNFDKPGFSEQRLLV